MNILFIMTDQLRVDYLSIYGNKILQTPAIDRIGREGTVFKKAFVQQAVCGPSRACFYTGRYVHTHRSAWNEVPLPITEKTAGHYFEEAGYRAAVIGKTHMYSEFPKPDFVKDSCHTVDPKELSRIDSVGFEYITGSSGTPCVPNHQYIQYLQEKGYQGDGQELLHSIIRPDSLDKGSYPDYCRRPSMVKKEDSPEHYLTDRAIDFMRETDKPWFLHLSYFRPHHPNHAPIPYNTMYDEKDFPAPIYSEDEKKHPLFKEFREERNAGLEKGDAYNELHCRHWRAVYAGLIKEIDDNLLRLFNFMDETGLMDNTMIIFTSDHGEFAGDHGFFEKEMCYRQSYHVPLLIRHPGFKKGNYAADFVESVDILPTCLESAGLSISPAIQGKSLMPFLQNRRPENWRQETIAEWTFEYYNACTALGLPPEKCRAIMIRNDRYSYCYFNGLPDMLFDLEKDPDELHNVANNPDYATVIVELKNRIIDWQLETWDPLPLKVDTGWPAPRGIGPKLSDMPYNKK